MAINFDLNFDSSLDQNEFGEPFPSAVPRVTEFDPLLSLLEVWELPQLLPLLKNFNITVESFPFLQLYHLDKIFHRDEQFGQRIIFEGKLNEWRVINNYKRLDEHLTDSNSSQTSKDIANWVQETGIPSTTGESSSSESFVFSRFMQSPQGKKIMSIYKSQEPPQLTQEARQYLVKSIIHEFMSKDLCMEMADFRTITKEITNTFTSEKGEFYFKPSSEQQRCATGYLYNKYRNCSSRLRSKGIFSGRKRRSSSKSSDDSCSSDKIAVCVVDENFEVNKTWLKCFHEPWEALELKWQTTFQGRRNELCCIESPQEKISNFLIEWPLFTSANGSRLVDIDFENLHKNKNFNLITKWPSFIELADQVLMQHINDKNAKKDLSKIKFITNTDSKNFKYFKLLHYALPPTSRASKPGQKKCIWKPSIENSIGSFILEIASHDLIETKLHEIRTRYAEYGQNLQPLVMIVGTDEKEFVSVFDNIIYKFSSLLAAVDCCFKLFFVFDLKYPIESTKVWTFIQQHFYEISTKHDIVDSKLIIMLSDFKYQK